MSDAHFLSSWLQTKHQKLINLKNYLISKPECNKCLINLLEVVLSIPSFEIVDPYEQILIQSLRLELEQYLRRQNGIKEINGITNDSIKFNSSYRLQFEYSIIVSNFENSKLDLNSRYYYFRIISSNDPNAVMNEDFPKTVVVPHLVKQKNFLKRKERFLNKSCHNFLKLELELTSVTMLTNENNNIVEEIVEDIDSEKRMFVVPLEDLGDLTYCYFNNDPENDIILCLNSSEFIRQICPQYMGSESGFTLLFLDKKISAVSQDHINSVSQKDAEMSLFETFSRNSLHNVASSTYIASNPDTNMSSLLASSITKKRHYSEVDESLTSCISSEINGKSICEDNNTTNSATEISTPPVGLHRLLDLSVCNNEKNDELPREEVCIHNAQRRSFPRVKWTNEMVREEALKYNSRVEFCKANNTAYQAALKRGIIDEVCQHMEVRRMQWTDELLRDEALKYNSRSEFHKASASAYTAAARRGIIDELCQHMANPLMQTKWTDELLREEALKYNSRTEFSKANASAYIVALKRGIIDEVCQHMEVYRKQVKWTEELLRDEALKYNSRSEFGKANGTAYHAAHSQGIIDEVCQHMEIRRMEWTDEMLREEALKYNSRTEFSKANASAYTIARKRGIIDEVCQHMTPSVKTKWTDEMINEEALKYNSRSEFCKVNNYVYQTALKRGIIDEVCQHMAPLLMKSKWTDEMLREEALKYNSRTAFCKANASAYTIAHRRGIIDEVCQHMVLDLVKSKWTDELLREEALKYNSRTEFGKANNTAYQTALKRGIIDEVCQHMAPQNQLKSTDELLREEALKYNSRSEFGKGNCTAYQTALKRGIIDEVCQHMEVYRKQVKWTDELLREEALKYNSRIEFCKASASAYTIAHRRGIIDELCQHMVLDLVKSKWTDELLREEALKYNSRTEFGKANNTAYQTALKRGIIDEVCQHMAPQNQLKSTDELLREEALKYNSRSEFGKGNCTAYQTALKRGIIDEVCQHMEVYRKQVKWTDELLREEALKYNSRIEFCKASASAYTIAHKRGIIDEVCQHMEVGRKRVK